MIPTREVPPGGEVLIITGMSGAGKTRAAGALDDLGWYVVSNLPPQLIADLAGMMRRGQGPTQPLAVVVDVRSRPQVMTLLETVASLPVEVPAVRIVFLDASDEVLVRRYDEARRPHPLQRDGTILDGIHQEREILAPLRERAACVIDTSALSIHDLARTMHSLVGYEEGSTRATVMSFGFKHGLPLDADHVVDVRFLANPYWVPELREHTGLEAPVKDYVLGLPGARLFVDRYVEALEPVLDGYARELKPAVLIAVGCTGGKHRSVVIAEAISGALRERGRKTMVIHRDVSR